MDLLGRIHAITGCEWYTEAQLVTRFRGKRQRARKDKALVCVRDTCGIHFKSFYYNQLTFQQCTHPLTQVV